MRGGLTNMTKFPEKIYVFDTGNMYAIINIKNASEDIPSFVPNGGHIATYILDEVQIVQKDYKLIPNKPE